MKGQDATASIGGARREGRSGDLSDGVGDAGAAQSARNEAPLSGSGGRDRGERRKGMAPTGGARSSAVERGGPLGRDCERQASRGGLSSLHAQMGLGPGRNGGGARVGRHGPARLGPRDKGREGFILFFIL